MSSFAAPTMSPLPIIHSPWWFSLLLDRPFTNIERSWMYRSVFAPFVSLQWSSFIARFYQRYAQVAPSTPVLRKPLVEYAIGGLSQRARMRILVNHYRLLVQQFRPEFVRDLCEGQKKSLATFVSKGEEFKVWVAASDQACTTGEGEIVFALEQAASRTVICKLTVFLDCTEGDPVLVIGGLRSCTGFKSVLTAATRKLEGLRPKDALLLAVRSFATAAGFHTLHAICNDRHVEKSGGKLFANFDEYWLERGAKPGGAYGFTLAAALPTISGQTRRDLLKKQIVSAVYAAAALFVPARLPKSA